MVNKIKTAAEIESMRKGGKILATVLEELKLRSKPGMSTKDLSDIAHLKLKELGGEPAFLGYHGYPDIVCITVNDEVQHTIPSPTKIIAEGDIVNCDFGVLYEGLITDAAITFPIGEVSEEALNLMNGTRAALDAAIRTIRHGVRVKEISKQIDKTLRSYGLGIVRELCGHGVGNQVHEDPTIPNRYKDADSFRLKAGMTVAIEPIATSGSSKVKFMPDGWNILTEDGSLAAQYEHTLLVTEHGCEILTQI